MTTAARTPLVCLTLLVASCTTQVVGDLPETEANRVVTHLERAGIPAEKRRSERGREVGWSVHVSDADAPAARSVLEGLSLPRPSRPGFEALLEESSIVPSATRERLRESVARSQEIEEALVTVDGVVNASVLVASADARSTLPGSGGEPASISASVLLHHVGEIGVGVPEIQRLVAGAVTGVEPEDVTVILSRTTVPRVEGERYERLGPFVVGSGSRTPLAVVLGIMALLNLLLGGWVVLHALRTRRARSPAEGEPAPAS